MVNFLLNHRLFKHSIFPFGFIHSLKEFCVFFPQATFLTRVFRNLDNAICISIQLHYEKKKSDIQSKSL